MICDKRIGNPFVKFLRGNRVVPDVPAGSSNAGTNSNKNSNTYHKNENTQAV